MLAIAALTGCQSTNRPLASGGSNPRPVVIATDGPGDPYILMAFSGGGSRAAGLSYAVLQQLRGLTYTKGTTTVSLADRIGVISSVSGGSVTAAYFGATSPSEFSSFDQKFLERNNMATLEWTAVNPITWLRLAINGSTRIDIFRSLLDKELFAGKTFADFNQPGKPIILLNATDMASGEVFAFTPQRFNDICSDLSQMPLSVAVASSAAFPIALSPVNIRDFGGKDCVGAVPTDDWIADDLKHPMSRYLNLEEFKSARYSNDLRHGKDAFRDIEYLHLLDGGIADNQGIHSLIDVVMSPHGPVRLLDAINEGHVKTIVVIIVNARSDAPSRLDKDSRTPGIISMIETVTGVPIDAATAGLNENMQLILDTLAKDGQDAQNVGGSPLFAGLRVYGIQIDFDQFHPDQSDLRDQVKAIGTTWTLSAEQRDLVARSGALLLRQHPCFNRLAADLNLQGAVVDTSVEGACSLVVDIPARSH